MRRLASILALFPALALAQTPLTTADANHTVSFSSNREFYIDHIDRADPPRDRDTAEAARELISSAISAAFWNGGQNCSANMRQIVHAKVKDAFLEEYVSDLKDPGDPNLLINVYVQPK